MHIDPEFPFRLNEGSLEVYSFTREQWRPACVSVYKHGRKVVSWRVHGKPRTRNERCSSLARVLYAVSYGPIPLGLEIDHINGDPTDDRLENLRAVTKSENISAYWSLVHAGLKPYPASRKQGLKRKRSPKLVQCDFMDKDTFLRLSNLRKGILKLWYLKMGLPEDLFSSFQVILNKFKRNKVVIRFSCLGELESAKVTG